MIQNVALTLGVSFLFFSQSLSPTLEATIVLIFFPTIDLFLRVSELYIKNIVFILFCKASFFEYIGFEIIYVVAFVCRSFLSVAE